jgi:hypothetical protein
MARLATGRDRGRTRRAVRHVAPAVSQHLGVLTDAGLVGRHTSAMAAL